MKTRLTAITDEGVEAVRTAEDGAEEPVKIACDYVVMAVGSKANAFDLDGVTVPVTWRGRLLGRAHRRHRERHSHGVSRGQRAVVEHRGQAGR